MRQFLLGIAVGVFGLATTVQAQFQDGDIVMGLGTGLGDIIDLVDMGEVDDTVAIIRDGILAPDPFAVTFVDRMTFDNLNGVRNNINGSLLAVAFAKEGIQGNGGEIYQLTTDGSGSSRRIGDFLGGFPSFNGLTIDVFADVAVSPDNSLVVIASNAEVDPDPNVPGTGALYLFDYNPGAASATDVLSNARELPNAIMGAGEPSNFGSSGIHFLDNDTIMLVSGDSGFFDTIEIDGSGNFGAQTNVLKLLGPNGGVQPDDGDTAGIAYDPSISPYVWVALGDFASGVINNFVWALDPDNNFNIVAEARYDNVLNSIQTIELQADGDVVVSAFGGTVAEIDTSQVGTTAPGSGGLVDDAVTILVTANQFDLPALMGDANKDGLVTGADLISVQQQFGKTGPTPLPGDANNDGQVTGADLIAVQQGFGTEGDGDVGFNGIAVPKVGATSPVPEPASLALVILAAGSMALRRRK